MAASSLEGFESGFLPLFYSFSTVSDVASFFDQHSALISTLHSGSGSAPTYLRLTTNAQSVVDSALYENASTRYDYLSRVFAENTSTEVFSPVEATSPEAQSATCLPTSTFVRARVAPVIVRQCTHLFSRRYLHPQYSGKTRHLVPTLSAPAMSPAVVTSRAAVYPTLGGLSLGRCLPMPSVSFSYSMQGDYFTFVGSSVLSSSPWASTQEAQLPALLTAQTYTPLIDPTTAVAYDSVELERPVRLGVTKVYEPSLFAGKTDGVPTNLLRFTNKLLFDWSMNWSNQTMGYALPLYKTYRGGFIRKPNSNYWSTGGVSLAEYDKCIWSDFFVQITKTASFRFLPSAQVRINNSLPAPQVSPQLDSELVPFVKNQIHLLPSTHEEFDINYVYQHWAPEINTTRRSDHASRFRVA